MTLTGPFGIPIAEVRGDVINELVPTGVGHVEVPFDGVPPLLLLFADITLTPVPGEGASAGDMLPAAISKTAMGWAVPWALLGGLALTALIIWGASTMRRRHREQLAAELADYTEQVRAEALAQPELEGADR